MKNYIKINGKKIPITEEQIEELKSVIRDMDSATKGKSLEKLAWFDPGDVVSIGGKEFIILDQSGDTTALIFKELFLTREKFGSSNNYDGSYVDKVCCKFAEDLESIVGERNLVLHTVDLTSDDGLKDYGKIQRRVSMLTADMYRRYADVLDKFKQDNWWWLATPYSTKQHDNDLWVKCVSPSGCLDYYLYGYGGGGVRPFCILKSDIFVSR